MRILTEISILVLLLLPFAPVYAAGGDDLLELTESEISVNQINENQSPENGNSTMPAGENLSLAELFEIAFNENPGILSARMNWRAMVEMYPQVTALPDPQLKLNWFPEPIETRHGSNDFGLQLMQMIPNPRRLDLMGEMSLTRAEMARVSYEKTVRDVLTEVMKSYFELGYLQRAIEIAQINRELFEQLVEFGNLQYSQGAIGAAELYLAESRLGQAQYEELLLMELLYSEESNMRNQLGVDPVYPIGAVQLPQADAMDLDLEHLRDLVRGYRLELEMAGISVEMADLNVSIARAMDDPNYSLGLMYNFIGTSPMDAGMRTSGDDAWGIMFGITLPIWGGKNDARIDQAELELESALAGLEDQENQAYADVERLYWQILNKGRLVELYRETLLPEAVSAVDLSQTWYEDGRISFSNLVETRMVLQNFQMATARAEADYLVSLAELQKITGVPVFNNESEVVE